MRRHCAVQKWLKLLLLCKVTVYYAPNTVWFIHTPPLPHFFIQFKFCREEIVLITVFMKNEAFAEMKNQRCNYRHEILIYYCQKTTKISIETQLNSNALN